MDDAQRLEKLSEIVDSAFGTLRPARGLVAEYMARREREVELDGIDMSNIIQATTISASGRPKRIQEHDLGGAPSHHRCASRRYPFPLLSLDSVCWHLDSCPLLHVHSQVVRLLGVELAH